MGNKPVIVIVKEKFVIPLSSIVSAEGETDDDYAMVHLVDGTVINLLPDEWDDFLLSLHSYGEGK